MRGWACRCVCVCVLKENGRKNTFVERSRIILYICIRAHADTANGKRDVRWILCDIDLSLLFFSLDPLSSHSPPPPPSASSPPTKSLFSTSSLTHTHTPAMPPARRLSFRPENRGKLYPFGVFRVRQHARISSHITSHYIIPCEHRMWVMLCTIGCRFLLLDNINAAVSNDGVLVVEMTIYPKNWPSPCLSVCENPTTMVY